MVELVFKHICETRGSGSEHKRVGREGRREEGSQLYRKDDKFRNSISP